MKKLILIGLMMLTAAVAQAERKTVYGTAIVKAKKQTMNANGSYASEEEKIVCEEKIQIDIIDILNELGKNTYRGQGSKPTLCRAKFNGLDVTIYLNATILRTKFPALPSNINPTGKLAWHGKTVDSLSTVASILPGRYSFERKENGDLSPVSDSSMGTEEFLKIHNSTKDLQGVLSTNVMIPASLEKIGFATHLVSYRHQVCAKYAAGTPEYKKCHELESFEVEFVYEGQN